MKVFVVNKSSHDFSAARKYGDLIFLSEGPMNRYCPNNMFRQFMNLMKDSEPSDYIVPCSLTTMNMVAGAIFGHLHGTLNVLLFKNGVYIPRNLDFRGGSQDADYSEDANLLEDGCAEDEK